MRAALLLLATPAVLPLAATASSAAEPGDRSWFEAGGGRSWLASYDPTLIGRRVLSEFSYEDDRDEQSTAKISTSARFAASPWRNVALGAQVELPVKWSETGSGYASGLGDFEFRAGIVARLSAELRWGGGLNLKVPTATNPALGDDAVEVRPIVGASWDVRSWLNLGFNAAYSVTPSEGGSNGVNKLELEFPVAFKMSADWSGAVTYKPTWYFNGADATYKLELGATRLLGERKRFALSPALEVPISSESFQWKAILGLAWYF